MASISLVNLLPNALMLFRGFFQSYFGSLIALGAFLLGTAAPPFLSGKEGYAAVIGIISYVITDSFIVFTRITGEGVDAGFVVAQSIIRLFDGFVMSAAIKESKGARVSVPATFFVFVFTLICSAFLGIFVRSLTGENETSLNVVQAIIFIVVAFTAGLLASVALSEITRRMKEDQADYEKSSKFAFFAFFTAIVMHQLLYVFARFLYSNELVQGISIQ